MRVIIETVAYGGWYPRGAARMIEEFEKHSPGYEIKAWTDELPPGAPALVEEGGRDYTGYCAKPFALKHAMDSGADVGILLDAAFFPIRSILPLIKNINWCGYYLCDNGYSVGQWASDRALFTLGVSREQAFKLPECSSYAVGFAFRNPHARALIQQWCDYARDGVTFPGPHTNTAAGPAASHLGAAGGGRNPGYCSSDPRVSGHRHDQTALAVLAHRFGFCLFTRRPKFTTYAGSETEETVLVNRGGL